MKIRRVNVAAIVKPNMMGSIKRINNRLYSSEAWYMSYATALGLIGGMFSVHSKQNDYSHHQGIVIGFEQLSNGDFKIFYVPVEGSVKGRGLPWAQELAIY